VTTNKRRPGAQLKLKGVPDPKTHRSGTFVGMVVVRRPIKPIWIRVFDGAGNPSAWKRIAFKPKR
jgi:hypothetical protein